MYADITTPSVPDVGGGHLVCEIRELEFSLREAAGSSDLQGQ